MKAARGQRIHDFKDDIDLLRSLVDYNPDSGVLTWHKSRKNAIRGSVVGALNMKGYLICGLLGRRYLAHHVAWTLFYGKVPEADLDHINGVKSDNRISNLREVTNSQNMMNTELRQDNTSGAKGVSWDNTKKLWMATITVKSKIHYLGRFKDLDEAIDLRKKAEEHYHGTFAWEQPDKPSNWSPEELFKPVSNANTSGQNGVVWDRSKNKWAARICINKKHIHLGRFDEFSDAVAARREAEIHYAETFKPRFRYQPAFN